MTVPVRAVSVSSGSSRITTATGTPDGTGSRSWSVTILISLTAVRVSLRAGRQPWRLKQSLSLTVSDLTRRLVRQNYRLVVSSGVRCSNVSEVASMTF